jgi:hypothetical protein
VSAQLSLFILPLLLFFSKAFKLHFYQQNNITICLYTNIKNTQRPSNPSSFFALRFASLALSLSNPSSFLFFSDVNSSIALLSLSSLRYRSLFLSLYLFLYIYIYMYLCLYLCPIYVYFGKSKRCVLLLLYRVFTF